MKALPNLGNETEMAARGRRSSLMSARNDALETLRDAFVQMQSASIDSMDDPARLVIEIAERLMEISLLWRQNAGA